MASQTVGVRQCHVNHFPVRQFLVRLSVLLLSSPVLLSALLWTFLALRSCPSCCQLVIGDTYSALEFIYCT